MMSWDVFRQADTADWREAFAFAKPVVGIEEWSELDPAPADAISKTLTIAEVYGANPPGLVADLVERADEAEVTNSTDWRRAMFDTNLGPRLSIFHHPDEEGDAVATFTIALPEVDAGERLVLDFGTGFSEATENGGRFAIRVNGDTVWQHLQRTRGAERHTVDLTRHAGETIRLELAIDALGNMSFDWANWILPQIVVTESGT
jgi:hypothetical protein